MKTKVFLEEFKGHPMFAIWEVDEQGNKIGQYPLLSMGAKKANALAAHIQELKAFTDARGVPAKVENEV